MDRYGDKSERDIVRVREVLPAKSSCGTKSRGASSDTSFTSATKHPIITAGSSNTSREDCTLRGCYIEMWRWSVKSNAKIRYRELSRRRVTRMKETKTRNDWQNNNIDCWRRAIQVCIRQEQKQTDRYTDRQTAETVSASSWQWWGGVGDVILCGLQWLIAQTPHTTLHPLPYSPTEHDAHARPQEAATMKMKLPWDHVT